MAVVNASDEEKLDLRVDEVIAPVVAESLVRHGVEVIGM